VSVMLLCDSFSRHHPLSPASPIRLVTACDPRLPLCIAYTNETIQTAGLSRVLVRDDDNDIPKLTSLHHHPPESPSPLVASTPDARLALCQQRTASLSAVHSVSASSAQRLCQQRTTSRTASRIPHSAAHCAAHSVVTACCFCLLFVSQYALLVCLVSMPR
jgi:hypothetical protein